MRQQEIDPVCGMTVVPDDAEAVFEYRGEDFYFCCEQCLSEFKANPEAYAQKAHAQKQPTGD